MITVTARLPVDGLHTQLVAVPEQLLAAGIVSVTRIGDCYAPSTIQAAVYSGHKVARGLDEMPTASEDLIRELPSMAVKT